MKDKTTIRKYPRRDLQAPEKRRDVKELLSFSGDVKLSKDKKHVIRRVTREEASDLWAIGKTIYFNIVNVLETFWPNYSLSKHVVKSNDDPLINSMNFFSVVEKIVPNHLPKSKNMYYFIKIPIPSKVSR